MNAVMFSCGILVGLFFGAMVWEAFVAGPEYARARRREVSLSDRVQVWQRMYLYADGARVATSKAMFHALKDNDGHSVKVPDLKAVK
jgi:hypothetical protein